LIGGRSLLRFITCGSVDDGKSTMIGRLLFESLQVFDDRLQALAGDSKKHGTQGEGLDFALLVDGLQAEREQGITIDVAYMFFGTPRRQFIAADTPGHEQYTRNMATGASTADLAVVLVDARKGVLAQTRRHTRIVGLMGIRDVVLAVNKMDLVHYAEPAFNAIASEYARFAAECGIGAPAFIPISALEGDNLTRTSAHMPWYAGPTLLQYLETVEPVASAEGPFRMPVQWVNRPDQGFRGFCGRVIAGQVSTGDLVRVLPSGAATRVKRIVAWKDDRDRAVTGESTTLILGDEIDVSRGDVLASAEAPPDVADQFEAHLLWMGAHDLMPGRPYLVKMHAKEITASVMEIKYRLDVNSGAHLAAKTLALNEIGLVTVAMSQPVVFEPYRRNRSLGAFVVIDKLTYETVGAGMIVFALRRAANIHWQALEIDRTAHAMQKHQRPYCVWFTGLSGSGKSTIANLVEKRLFAAGRHTYVLDGDNIRHGLNRDLGFTEPDRVENIRRVAEVAKLMVDAGLIALVSFISPFRSERRLARELFGPDEFVEVFVDAPLEECERRDPKGLYRKARQGTLRNFTGIDGAYEPPEAPDVHVLTAVRSADDCAAQVFARIE
jgi:bifunctional enzyme CysN/CysC